MTRSHNRESRSTSGPYITGSWKLLALCLTVFLATAGYLNTNYIRSGEAKASRRTPVESFEAGLKMARFNIQLGTDTTTTYQGAALGEALLQGQATPLAMTAEDLNGDGMPELVTGYAAYGRGLVTLRIGNIEAISPQTPEVSEGLRAGRYPSPFLNDVITFELPEAPDFLVSGDFNADGYADVVAAARGGLTLYLLPGDGLGGLRALETISMPGQITAMTRGEFNERDSLVDLILGVVDPGGAKALVFEGRNRGLAGEAEEFALPGAASILALGQFSDGTAQDLAAAIGNTIAIVQGRNPLVDGSVNEIERVDLPYNVRAMTAGNFFFDREGKAKLALLSDDGMIHLISRGQLDTRPYTQQEQDRIREARIEIRRGLKEESTLTILENSMILRQPKDRDWVEAESRSVGAMQNGAVAPEALLTAAHVSSLPTDDLLFLGSANDEIQILRDSDDAGKLNLDGLDATTAIESLASEGSPIAVVTARLSVDSRPSMVVLTQGKTDPLVILSVSSVFNVTKTADTADGTCNADCSLREAVIAANHTAGSHTINVPNGTYTLTIGPFDDDFNFGGDAEASGDLDIMNLGFGMTGVSIVGTSQAGTIIQMGTLSPAGSGTGAGITKDRILEVNNFITPQRGLAVSISNATFQNGVSAATAAPDNYHHPGGAIMFDGFDQPTTNPTGTLTLTSVKLTNNSGAAGGGGVLTVDASLTLQTGSVVSSNTSPFSAGGGISYNGGNKVAGQTLTVTGSTIGGAGAGNTAVHTGQGNGGGIATLGGAGATIQSSSVISNNTAGALDAGGADSGGGGILFSNTPAIAISNSTIANNISKIHGGGIWVSARIPIVNVESTITLTGTSVTGNTADSDNTGGGNGGGIDVRFGALTVQSTSHIDSNTAVNGGGIYNQWNLQTNDKPGSVTVNTSSTIGQSGAGNNAKNNGGGIAIDVGGNSATTPKTGAVTLTSVSLTNNTANSDNTSGGEGGGIHDTGNDSNFRITLTLDGATIDSNVANSGTGDGLFLQSGTVTCSNTVSFSGDDSLNINGGTFTSTSGTLNLAGNFTRSSAGVFNHNSGILNFNGGGAQNINGTATSENFNNFTVNKGGGTLTGAGSTTSLTINGNVTLSAGTFKAGTLTAIGLPTGNWTNNGGVFTPDSSVISFTNTAGAQNINGSAATQTFNSITVAKTAQTLSVAGSTTTLNLNGTMLLTSGIFSAGTAANINIGTDWTNNGGTFTPGTGTVTFNGGAAQNLNGSAATQTFNNFTVSKGGGTLTGAGSTTSLTINGSVTLSAGTFKAGTLTAIGLPTGNWTNNGGLFTPDSSVISFTNTAGAQAINGSNASQTFNSITVAKTAQTLSVAGSTTTLNLNGTMLLTSGIFSAGTAANINVAGNWTNNGGAFTPGSGTVTFNGGAAQNLNGSAATQTFNNFTVSKGGGTLTGGGSTTTLTVGGSVNITAGTFATGTITTINVAGNWSNAGTFSAGASNTVVFNGNNNTQTLAGNTTFNNLTINHTGTGGVTATGSTFTVTGLLRIQAGTFTSSSNFNNVQIDSGATLASDGSTMNVSGNWTNNGTFTPGSGTVVFNGNNNTQTLAGTTTFNNLTINHTGTGNVTATGSALAVSNLLRIQAGTFISSSTFKDVQIDSGATLQQTAATTMNVSGNWTNNGSFTASTGTVNLNGSAAQTIGGSSATTFNNLTDANTAAPLAVNTNANAGGALTVNANAVLTPAAAVIIGGGGTLTGDGTAQVTRTAATADFSSQYTITNKTLTNLTVEYIGGAAQTGSALTYGNLKINNSSGVTLGGNANVNGVLTLMSGDLNTTGSFTLTMPVAATSAGTTDVVGNVKRTGFVIDGAALSFGNPFNSIKINTGTTTAPTDVNVNLDKAVPTTPAPFATAIARKYTITPTGGSGISATLRLHYLDAELNGNTEGAPLNLFRYDGSNWHKEGQTANDMGNNWVEKNNVTQFSPWTMNSTVPTEVRIESVTATAYDGGTLIEWRTGSEVDNLGFNVYRDEGGKRVPVNSQIVAGSALLAGSGTKLGAGRSYSWWDKGIADCGSRIADCGQYWIEDIDLNGTRTLHGPVSIKHIGGVPIERSSAAMLSQVGIAQSGVTRPLAITAPLAFARPDQIGIINSLAGQTAVKLAVKREGFYRVTGSDLFAAGLDPKAGPDRLQLYADGKQVPIKVAADKQGLVAAVEFYGVGLDTASTDARVYWLIAGSQTGLRIARVKGSNLATAASSFLSTVERKDRTIYFSSLRNGERENFFGAVVAGEPVDQSLVLRNVDSAANAQATIEVALQGVTTSQHRVWAYVNGSFAGELLFDGQAQGQAKLSVSQSLLREGDNTVRLVAQGGPSDVSLVNYIRVSYWHGFAADDNALWLTATGGQATTVSGFTSAAIRVFDVTVADRVEELAAKVEQQKGGYSATFASPRSGERRLLAIADEKADKPAGVAANRVSNLRGTNHAADLVIITRRDFSAAFDRLAKLRASQGIKAELVDIEDIYDEFSFGNKSPQAVKDFLQYAKASWKTGPRFVLLAGDSSYDPRNYLGLGDWDIAPAKLIDTGLMETLSDDWYADFDNDGLAELAVGRLPVRTVEEAAAIVEKIISYEGGSPSEEVLLVADVSDTFDFEGASAQLRALIPPNLRVNEIDRGGADGATARIRLIEAINRGQKVVNYVGHGSVNLWRGGLLSSEDASLFENVTHPSLFIMMTCLNGYSHEPALDSLAEALMKARGGAVAVWASSGMTGPDGQTTINQQMYRLMFDGGGSMTLGEATNKAKATVSDNDVRRTWILLGDPTMRLR